VAASGFINMQKQLDLTSNNLANVNTPGFKKDRLVFQSFLSESQKHAAEIATPPGSPADPAVRSFPRKEEPLVASERYTDFEQGAFQNTQNELDLAIEGEGFFAVRTDEGVRYTRAGNFKVGADGELVTSHGYRVLSTDGRTILIKEGSVNVHPDGSVFVSERKGDRPDRTSAFLPGMDPSRLAGKLQVVTFRDTRVLVKEGEGLFSSQEPGRPMDPSKGKVLQGYLEQSNVNAIQEMIQLIEVMRRAQSYQKVIQTSDDMTGRLISEGARTS
jgi:flagellar basal-body rod protein FlgG